MSAITQSPDFAVAPQKADDKLAANPQLTATAVDESNKTDSTPQQRTEQNYQQAERKLDEGAEKDELGREQLEKMAQQLQDFMDAEFNFFLGLIPIKVTRRESKLICIRIERGRLIVQNNLVRTSTMT